MADNEGHQALNDALSEGVRSLQKWYDRVDGTSSPAYLSVLVRHYSLFYKLYVLTFQL